MEKPPRQQKKEPPIPKIDSVPLNMSGSPVHSDGSEEERKNCSGRDARGNAVATTVPTPKLSAEPSRSTLAAAAGIASRGISNIIEGGKVVAFGAIAAACAVQVGRTIAGVLPAAQDIMASEKTLDSSNLSSILRMASDGMIQDPMQNTNLDVITKLKERAEEITGQDAGPRSSLPSRHTLPQEKEANTTKGSSSKSPCLSLNSKTSTSQGTTSQANGTSCLEILSETLRYDSPTKSVDETFTEGGREVDGIGRQKRPYSRDGSEEEKGQVQRRKLRKAASTPGSARLRTRTMVHESVNSDANSAQNLGEEPGAEGAEKAEVEAGCYGVNDTEQAPEEDDDKYKLELVLKYS